MSKSSERSSALRALNAICATSIVLAIVYLLIVGMNWLGGLVLAGSLVLLLTPVVMAAEGVLEAVAGVFEAFADGVSAIVDGISRLFSDLS